MLEMFSGDRGKAERLVEGSRSTLRFAEIYLKDSFYDPFTWQQKEAMAVIDDETIPKVAELCWRGWGKSTVLAAKAIRSLCYRQYRHILWFGANLDSAMEWTENVKFLICDNDAICRDFGRLVSQAHFEGETKRGVTKKGYWLKDPGTHEPIGYVAPKGFDQRFRGKSVAIGLELVRPELMLGDDAEDDTEVWNDDIRIATRKRFFSTILHLVGRQRPDARTNRWHLKLGCGFPRAPWRFIMVDTLKHPDGLIGYLINATEWVSLTYPQSKRIVKDGVERYKSLVPELISDEQVNAEIDQSKNAGAFEEYCREKMCLPQPPDVSCWTRDMFQRYDDSKSGLQHRDHIWRVVFADPARTANPNSDLSAFTAVAIAPQDAKIYVRKQVSGRFPVAEKYQQLFALMRETNSRILAIERAGGDDDLMHQVQNEARQAGLNIRIVPLNAGGRVAGVSGSVAQAGKHRRAATALAHYSAMRVWHDNALKNGRMETEMLAFPGCKHWDELDTMGYLDQFMADQQIWFPRGPAVEHETVTIKTHGDEKYRESIRGNTWDNAIRSGQWRKVDLPL